MKYIKKTAILLTVLLFAFSSKTYAQQQFPLFTVHKDNSSNIFDVTCEQGKSASISFKLENRSINTLSNTLMLYDAITRNNGGTKILNPDTYIANEVGSWFDFEVIDITLDAGKMSDTITIDFTVPEDTPPGNYAAIFALNTRQKASTVNTKSEDNLNKDNVGINIIKDINITSDAIIRVPGKYQRNMTLDKNFEYRLDNDKLNMSYFIPFSNNSTAYDFPIFRAEVFNENEELIFENHLKANISYANQSAYYVFVDDVNDYNYGEYRVEVFMEYGNNEFDGQEERTYYFSLEKAEVESIVEKREEKAIVTDNTLTDRQKWWLLNLESIIIVAVSIFALLIAIIIIILVARKKRKINDLDEIIKSKKTKNKGRHMF
jgi:hypothetical protein